MKRRTFLKRSLPIATVPFLVNGFSIKAFGKGSIFEQLLGAATANDRVLVIIQLTGGNDGLNTVIPLDKYSELSTARSNIMIPSNLVLGLNGSSVTGLHPSMTGMRNLFNNQQLAVVQGVSYPNPNFSHFRATDIWLTASDSAQDLMTGWTGRFLGEEYPGYPTGYPNTQYPDPLALQIGSVVSTAFQGPSVNMGIAIADPNNFYQLVNGTHDPAPNTPAGHELTFIRETSVQTNLYATSIKAAAGNQNNLSTLYPAARSNSLADQLKIVAQLIGGGLQTKVYMVNLGSFDTHSAQVDVTGGNQTGSHANLLAKVSEAITAFQDDITLMGQQDRVIGMTFSEFGRRIKSNGAAGTDHGSSAPMFLFGSKVKGGLLGSNPDIPNNAGVNDNLEMQHDFRSVYTSILKNWFCVPDDALNNTMLQTFNTLDLLTVSCSETGIRSPAEESSSLRNYPNPANSSTIIEFHTNGGNILITLFDETGREIQTVTNGNYPSGTHQVELDTRHLQKGIYLYTLRQGEQRVTRRMLVM
ncbi:MAG: DUF1501 domain-containing protein [Bacteroidetes bacterium]|nr:DUF1501 domain-containing protein [Bacteroidota bacterium]